MYAGYKRNRDGSVIPRKAVAYTRFIAKRSRRRSGRRRVGRRRATGTLMHKFTRYATIPTGNMSIINGSFVNQVLATTSLGGETETDFALYFKLSDLGSYDEFTKLFDQYQLSCVVLTIKMTNVPESADNPEATTGNYQNFYPTIWYAPDHDDIVTASLSDIKQYGRVKHRVLRPNRELKIVLRPTPIQSGLAAAGGATSYTTMLHPWINCANPDVTFYGLKGVIDLEGLTATAVANNTFQFRVNAKYYVRFRDSR